MTGKRTYDLKSDLEELLRGFRWNVVGLLLENHRVIDVPAESRAISAIFEKLVVGQIKPIAEKYGCEFERGGGREYPDITLLDIPDFEGKIAIDVKTSRKESANRIRGFTLGTCLGYFRTPDRKVGTVRYPYGDYAQHWIVGLCYGYETYQREASGIAEEAFRITDIDLIVHEKWRIASRRTGSGTTKHMRSITNIKESKSGRGEFSSKEEFLKYWRNY